MKIMLTPSSKINVVVSVLAVLVGLGFSLYGRSLAPLVFMSALLVVPGVVLASIANAVEVILGARPWGRYSSIHISIAFASIAFVLVGFLSIAERLVWFNSDTPPSIIISKAYGDRYTANKHRMFKFQCDTRDALPINMKEVGDLVYLRCGEWYPQVYTVSASVKAFAQAEAETRNDPPHMGFRVEKD